VVDRQLWLQPYRRSESLGPMLAKRASRNRCLMREMVCGVFVSHVYLYLDNGQLAAELPMLLLRNGRIQPCTIAESPKLARSRLEVNGSFG
jgi:hypothetical protein